MVSQQNMTLKICIALRKGQWSQCLLLSLYAYSIDNTVWVIFTSTRYRPWRYCTRPVTFVLLSFLLFLGARDTRFAKRILSTVIGWVGARSQYYIRTQEGVLRPTKSKGFECLSDALADLQGIMFE